MELFGIGWTEMLVIGIVALIVVGPDRLPVVARSIGRLIGYLSQQWRHIQQQIREPLEGEVRDIKEGIQDVKNEVSGIRPAAKKQPEEQESARR
jgi:sec-independent protein translocase protein TatB